MRVHFQDRPWDLVLALVVTFVLAGASIAGDVGSLALIPLIGLAPGYLVLGVLFPGRKPIDWIERLALSVGLSLAITIFLGLLLSSTPYGIGLRSTAAAIVLFNLLVGALAYRRRIRIPPGDRLALTFELPALNLKGLQVDRALSLALGASVVFAASAFIYVVVLPRPADRFTEFYLLGNYPTRLNVSEPATVTVGLANHEFAPMSYSLQVDLVGVDLVYNATTGLNDTVVLNRTAISYVSFSVEDGDNWLQTYPISIAAAGYWRIDFALYRGGDLTNPYRNLDVLVVVGAP